MIEWYYRDPQSQKVGPLTGAEFAVCVAIGEVRPETPVWRPGLTCWVPYEELLERAEEPSPISRGRQLRQAPRSTSYGTFIALGSSPHRTRGRLTTSGCTPAGISAPAWLDEPAEGAICRVELDPRSTDLVWLGRQFMQVALAGALILVAHTLLTRRDPPMVPLPLPAPSTAEEASHPALETVLAVRATVGTSPAEALGLP